MKIILIAAFILLSTRILAQDTTHNNISDTDTDKVFTEVETPAQFPGGDIAWNHFIETHIKPSTPAKHKAPRGKYVVEFRMTIDTSGAVQNILIIEDAGYGTGNDVLHALQHSPKWIPAEMHGRKVIYVQRQSIIYMVD